MNDAQKFRRHVTHYYSWLICNDNYAISIKLSSRLQHFSQPPLIKIQRFNEGEQSINSQKAHKKSTFEIQISADKKKNINDMDKKKPSRAN